MKKLHRLLAEVARRAVKQAYAPYSKFRVGAAVLGGSGKIYFGANVENASYGLTVCAERVAVYRAVTAGEKKILAVAVACGSPGVATPCGACRQVLSEFGKKMDVVLVSGKGFKVKKLSALLPDAFK